MGQVTYITWKTDLLVLGDVDGNINLWDLKAKVSRYVVGYIYLKNYISPRLFTHFV